MRAPLPPRLRSEILTFRVVIISAHRRGSSLGSISGDRKSCVYNRRIQGFLFSAHAIN